MANSDFNLNRDDIISAAFRKLRVIGYGVGLSGNQVAQGSQALNLIIREEDLAGTGTSRDVWAESTGTIILKSGGYIYSTSDGLKSDITEITRAVFRNTSGGDTPIDVISGEQYEEIEDKNETGDVCKIYLKRESLPANQTLYVWPVPTALGTTSEVIGSDSLNYSAIMGHTAASINQPITGGSYKLYWEQQGSSGGAWASGTSYTSGASIHYTYKRLLLDFDLNTDKPDMRQGMNRYLILRLAYDLSPEYGMSMDERLWLKSEYTDIKRKLFSSTQSNSQDFHNKGVFF
ncbi:MAG: hypothetical protein ACE5IR_22880 [bacterium]